MPTCPMVASRTAAKRLVPDVNQPADSSYCLYGCTGLEENLAFSTISAAVLRCLIYICVCLFFPLLFLSSAPLVHILHYD